MNQPKHFDMTDGTNTVDCPKLECLYKALVDGPLVIIPVHRTQYNNELDNFQRLCMSFINGIYVLFERKILSSSLVYYC